MAYSLTSSYSQQFGTSTPNTTTATDTTTGSPTICIVTISFFAGGGVSLSDATGTTPASNSWTQIATYNGAGAQSGIAMFYCNNFTAGASHTFTTAARFSNISILCFTGNRTASSPQDQINGRYISGTAGSNTPGSITPSENNCLVVSSVMDFGGTLPTYPTGYTGITRGPTGTAFAWGVAYQIQTTATATNPDWVGSTGSNAAVNVVSFLPPAAAASTTGAFLLNFM